MRGFVPTPPAIVDLMVELLFHDRQVTGATRVLDPGCGPGAFIEGVQRWSVRMDAPVPTTVGVELDPERSRDATVAFRSNPQVSIRHKDFLKPTDERFDYVIGNPPYVSIGHLSEEEKTRFRETFATARGRFDLYFLFFEHSLRLLKPGGRLVFITPEKFLYVAAAAELRRLLARHQVKEIRFADEATFPSHTTYPTITVVEKSEGAALTRVTLRDGGSRAVRFPSDGASLLPLLSGESAARTEGPTLGDVSLRVSCGVATGADEVFVVPTAGLPAKLRRFARPTISGRQLATQTMVSTDSMLMPYDLGGALLDEGRLGALGRFLEVHRERLSGRVCARRKPWYAFHDSVPMRDLMQPKIICKDVTSQPAFWLDETGEIVPRHSTYYVVPKTPEMLLPLLDWLRGEQARRWLAARCPRAANGFLRLQSSVLKELPVPASIARLAGEPSRRTSRLR